MNNDCVLSQNYCMEIVQRNWDRGSCIFVRCHQTRAKSLQKFTNEHSITTILKDNFPKLDIYKCSDCVPMKNSCYAKWINKLVRRE